MKIFNQLDPQFKKWYIGKVKTSSFANYACLLFCYTYMYSVKIGREVNPKEIDALFVKKNVYNGDLINNKRACEVLGLQWLGKETDINKAPRWYPNIKEVDYSIKDGKQTHFVIRELADGKRVIKDPIGGVARPINYYEKKVNNLNWSKPGFSYRLIKI